MSVPSPSWSRIPRAVAATVSLDAAPVGVLWVDYAGEIGYANRAVESLLGWAPPDLSGQNIALLAQAWHAAEWQGTVWQKAVSGGEFSVENAWERKGGDGPRLLHAALRRMQVAGQEFIAVYLYPPTPAESQGAALDSQHPDYIDHLPTGVGFVDAQLNLLCANPPLLATLGLDKSAALGQSIAELLAPAAPQVSRWHELTALGLKDWAFEFRNPQGRHCHLVVSAHPAAAGGAVQYLLSVEDASERVQLRRLLQQHEHSFEHLAENTPGMIYKFVLSADGRAAFPYASPGSRDIWEIDPDMVREDATPILNLIHADDVASFQEAVMRSAAELSHWEYEGRMVTPSGKLKWFHAASRPELADNGDIVWQGLLMDVSHQKQIEEELKHAKLKAESAARSKADFLANMSHEIRTPMNGVIGMAELLSKTELAQRQKYYVETIRSSAEVLLTIINDILDISKMEAGKLLLHPTVFDLRRTLEDVATLLAPRAFEKGLEMIVRYDPKAPSQVFGDGVRLRQVLTNLIGNAIKFTATGHVLAQVEEISRDGDLARLRFSVCDTGIGISQDAMRRIFDKFEQADSSTSRKFGGSGLGLSISRQLVELMGGELAADSELAQGSTFRFQLDLPVRDQALGQDVVTVDFGRLRVLAVDDHPVNRELLGDVFEDWGVAHAEADSGAAALRALRQAAGEGRPFDVAVLDFHMPGMDGLFLAQAIRAEPEIANVALILLSSSSFSDDQQRSLAEIGVAAQLLKPLRQFQLRSALIGLLENRPPAEGEPTRPAVVPRPVAAPPVRPVAQANIAPGLRVLLAEDNEVNIEIALDMLASLGLQADCAANGLEALELCKRQRYDLIFMDCQMPEMDGFEATAEIRKLAQTPPPVVVAMTAYAMEGDKERCLLAGMDDYLSKPVTFTKLSELAERHVQALKDRQADAAPCKQETGGQRQPPLFDLDAGLQVTGGKLDVLRRAIEIWWRKLPSWLTDLKEGVQRGDFRQIGHTAHTLRGASSNIGALSVARYAERIEAEARQNTLENVANLYECLVVDIERLRQATADLDASPPPDAGH
ncbi:MAG: response regulator [Candidatus Methylumidiphilus sp.]